MAPYPKQLYMIQLRIAVPNNPLQKEWIVSDDRIFLLVVFYNNEHASAHCKWDEFKGR